MPLETPTKTSEGSNWCIWFESAVCQSQIFSFFIRPILQVVSSRRVGNESLKYIPRPHLLALSAKPEPLEVSAPDLSYLENFKRFLWRLFAGAEIYPGFCSISRHCDMLVAKLENICSTQMIAFGSKNRLNDMMCYCRLTESVLPTVRSSEEWETESWRCKLNACRTHHLGKSPNLSVPQLHCLKHWDNNNT